MRAMLVVVAMFGLVVVQAPVICAQPLNPSGNVAPADSGFSVTGKVIGPGDQPQAGVPVQVEGPLGKTHVFTDANGNWSLYNVPPGTYVVRPLGNTPATQGQATDFTVKETGFFEKLTGGDKKVLYAPEMKLDKQFMDYKD